MVTAGVYLVVRSNGVFDASETARTAVVIVGLVTLLVGAWIGCTKDDIKKALAGSTMSQIGYMMLAAGLGPAGYAFAIFHLLTHGFFKANLFLGAGSVMHGMNDDVDMRHYGAIRAAMPVTFVTFALGYLAIIGVPPFAGFWSKDKIIETALAQSWWAGLGALIGAGITAFYMTRLFAMTFLGKERWLDDVHPHESPRVMTWPLIALAGLSAFGGALAIGGWITDWLAPITGEAHEHHLPVPAWVISLAVLAVVAIGVLLGCGRTPPAPSPARLQPTRTSRSSPGPGATRFTATPSTTSSPSGPRVTSSARWSTSTAPGWTRSSPVWPTGSATRPTHCGSSRTVSCAVTRSAWWRARWSSWRLSWR